MANVVERSFHIATDSKTIQPEYLPSYLIDEQRQAFNTVDNDMNQEHRIAQDKHALQNNKRTDGLNSEAHKKAKQFSVSLKENEEQLIRKAIVKSGYNISKASKVLGIARCTIYRKIKKYSISTGKN